MKMIWKKNIIQIDFFETKFWNSKYWLPVPRTNCVLATQGGGFTTAKVRSLLPASTISSLLKENKDFKIEIHKKDTIEKS